MCSQEYDSISRSKWIVRVEISCISKDNSSISEARGGVSLSINVGHKRSTLFLRSGVVTQYKQITSWQTLLGLSVTTRYSICKLSCLIFAVTFPWHLPMGKMASQQAPCKSIHQCFKICLLWWKNHQYLLGRFGLGMSFAKWSAWPKGSVALLTYHSCWGRLHTQ